MDVMDGRTANAWTGMWNSLEVRNLASHPGSSWISAEKAFLCLQAAGMKPMHINTFQIL